MAFQPTPYTVPLGLATLLSGAIALYAGWAYRRRDVERRSVGLFALAMATVSFWSGTYAIQLSTVSLSAKVYWVRWANTATLVAPTIWLLFALAYADHEEWLTPRVYGLLLVEPVVGVVANWTTALGGLMWKDFGRVQPSSFYLLDRTLGPLFVAHAVYSYLLVLLGGLLIVAKVHRSSRMYRGQAALLVGGTALPLLTNVGYMVGLGPDHVNLTPVAFAGTGLAFAVAIFHYGLLDVIPVARKTVIESMHEGYLVTDETGTVVDANPAARAFLDAADESIVGRPVRDVFPATEDLLPERELDAEGEARTEITVSASGERRHLDVTATPLYQDDYVGTLAVLRDITERRRRERRFRKLIENASDLITVLDEDGTIVYQSPSVDPLLGYEHGETEGKSVFNRIHPDDREDLVAEFRRAVNDPEYTTRTEYRVRAADGEWRVHEMVGRNLLEDPDVEGFVVNARDVTERVERERALERTNERLERFASIVSHDLRNPLNVAEGYVELLEADGEAVEAIEDSHERMHRIIEDVLTLAREGAEVSDRDPVRLGALAEDAWDFVDTKDATLEVTDDGTVRADESRLSRALENLFRNAVEHGRRDVTITVGRIDDGNGGSDATDEAGFYVADDGPGLPDDELGSPFEMGVTGSGDGTGFGLAIVADVVEAHGWEITAGESESGGARFDITGLEVE
jgi:PAS domain S-box-containing protein